MICWLLFYETRERDTSMTYDLYVTSHQSAPSMTRTPNSQCPVMLPSIICNLHAIGEFELSLSKSLIWMKWFMCFKNRLFYQKESKRYPKSAVSSLISVFYYLFPYCTRKSIFVYIIIMLLKDIILTGENRFSLFMEKSIIWAVTASVWLPQC